MHRQHSCPGMEGPLKPLAAVSTASSSSDCLHSLLEQSLSRMSPAGPWRVQAAFWKQAVISLVIVLSLRYVCPSRGSGRPRKLLRARGRGPQPDWRSLLLPQLLNLHHYEQCSNLHPQVFHWAQSARLSSAQGTTALLDTQLELHWFQFHSR